MRHKNIAALFASIVLSLSILGCDTSERSFKNVGFGMEPTISDGEMMQIHKSNVFEHGDIIVFEAEGHTDEYYLKRIIGTPGDKITLKAGSVWLNEEILEEPYVDEGVKTCLFAVRRECENDNEVFDVPEDKYFVLGDNRRNSSDSRTFYSSDSLETFIAKDRIIGKMQSK